MREFRLITILLQYNKIHPNFFVPNTIELTWPNSTNCRRLAKGKAMHCSDCKPGSPGSPLCSVQDDKRPLCKWYLEYNDDQLGCGAGNVKYFDTAALSSKKYHSQNSPEDSFTHFLVDH